MSNNNNEQPLDITASLPVATQGLSMEDRVGQVEEPEPAVTTQNLSHSDIDLLLLSVKRGESRGNQRLPSICKVSRILRDDNKISYEPQLVSIGPIHREDPKLQEFEWLKECYLHDLLSRCDSMPKEILLKACLQKVNTLIPQIRESYAGMIENYDDGELARMMVMDGCFILEFCFKHDEENLYLPNKMQNSRIAMDLILLENQVPFIVLKALFDCSMGEESFTLSNVLDEFLAPYINLFRPKISTTDVHSDLPKKTLTTDVHSDLLKQNSTTDVHSDLPKNISTTEVHLDLPKQNSTTDVDSDFLEKKSILSNVLDKYLAPYIKRFCSLLPEKISTTDVHSDSPKKISTTDDSDPTHDHVLGYLHKRYRLVAAKSSKPKHAEASRLADEEQAAKLSNPIHADKEGTRVGPGGSRDTHGILWCCVNFCKKSRFFLNAPSPKQLCSSFFITFRKCPGSNCVLAQSQHTEASKPVDEELAAKSSDPTDAEEDEEIIDDTAFHSIVELDRSGMNFKPHQEDVWSMTIKFQSSHFACLPRFWSKPTLLMPTLVIDDTTELILRNFIAYEQSFPTDRYYFTSYAHIMDMHIDTQEDIAKLVESKVLVNMLGSNQEAAGMINKLCKNISITEFYYKQEFKKVDKYYNRFWPKNIAKLRRIYFSNPWSAIALFAAIILFSLTVVQTVYTLMGT